MITLESKNEMLAEICKKLAENSAVPERLRVQARQFVEEFNSLLPYRGKGDPSQHFEGEQLLVRIARFLPRVTEVDAVKR